MPLDLKKLDAVVDGCMKLDRRMDAIVAARRGDAADPRAAATRELELLKSHLTDMTEAHERERVEGKIADLEAGIERMGAEAQTDKKGRKDATRKDTAYEGGMEDKDPRYIEGVKGANSRPFKKKFSNAAAMDKWYDSEEAGDVDVQRVYKA